MTSKNLSLINVLNGSLGSLKCECEDDSIHVYVDENEVHSTYSIPNEGVIIENFILKHQSWAGNATVFNVPKSMNQEKGEALTELFNECFTNLNLPLSIQQTESGAFVLIDTHTNVVYYGVDTLTYNHKYNEVLLYIGMARIERIAC